MNLLTITEEAGQSCNSKSVTQSSKGYSLEINLLDRALLRQFKHNLPECCTDFTSKICTRIDAKTTNGCTSKQWHVVKERRRVGKTAAYE